MDLIKQCATCGATFPKKPSISMKNWVEQTKFCSRPCFHAAPRSPETRSKMGSGWRGKPGVMTGRQHTAETKAKMSVAHTGLPGVHTTPHTEATKAQISANRTGKAVGAQNTRWLGDNVGYSGAHTWINRYFPKVGVCDLCTQPSSRTQRAMRDSNVLTRDPADWLELCQSCHKQYDFRSTVWAKSV